MCTLRQIYKINFWHIEYIYNFLKYFMTGRNQTYKYSNPLTLYTHVHITHTHTHTCVRAHAQAQTFKTARFVEKEI